MCIETTLHVYRNDFDLYRNDLYRNDFVSKRPDTQMTCLLFFLYGIALKAAFMLNYSISRSVLIWRMHVFDISL